jgi:nucleoside-diphosphate-sugar epimerase
MHIFVTGGTGHAGSYVIPDLIAAGHEVTGLTRSDKSAAAMCEFGARVRRGDLADLDGLKTAAAESDGVIHLGYRAELLPSGGIAALCDSELSTVRAFGEALAGSGKPLVVAGSIGAPTNVGRAGRIGAPVSLGRPATEDDPALPSGPLDAGTLVARNIVETSVVGLAKRGVRSSVVRIPPSHTARPIASASSCSRSGSRKRRASSAIPETARTGGPPCTSAISPHCSALHWRRGQPARPGTRSATRVSGSAR